MEVKRIPPTELYHHGIKGQEWGERNGPPYPLAPATSAAVKKSAVKKKKNFFERRRDKKKMKKLRDAKEQKKVEKEEREKIINSGNANEIDKIKHKLTDEEYARALSRINFNATLNEYKTAANRAKLEDISNKVSTVSKVVGNVANAAEAGVKVYEGLQRAGIIEKKTSEMDKLRNEKTRLELISEISNLTNAITDNKSRNQKEIADLKRKTELERANYDYEKAQKDRNDLKKGDDDFKKLERESKEWEYKAKIAKNQRTFNNGGMSDKEANKQQNNGKKDKNKSAFDGQNVNDAVDKAKRKKLDNKQDVNIAKTFVDAGLVPEVKKGLKGNKRAAVQAQLVREVYGDEHSGPFVQSEFKDWLKKKGYDAKDIQYLTGGSSIKHGNNMYSNVRRLRDDELAHHGIKGQKWGVRRYQNEDGSLTDLGRQKLQRYQEVESNRVSNKIGFYNNAKRKTELKYETKIAKAKEKGNTEKANKLKEKLSNDKRIKRLNDTISKGEKEYQVVKNMSFDDMKHERKVKAVADGKSFMTTAACAAILAATMPTTAGGSILVVPTMTTFRNSRELSLQKDRLKRYDKIYGHS